MATILKPIKEHARDLQEQIIKDKGITGDAKEAALAAALPSFSKGTLALDETTGQPIVEKPEEFATETVALPEGTETTGAQEGAPPQAPRQRDEAGKFVGERTEQTQAETPTQEAGAQAAEKVAEQITAEPQIEYEDFEFEDPDLSLEGKPFKIPMKVPKQYANTAKRGYMRRQEFDRWRQRWGNAAATLEPLLQDGKFNQILPLLQRAMNDQAYGEFVWQAYQRAQQGLPLTPQAVAPAPTPVAQPMQALPGQEPFVDPLLEQAIAPVLSRLQAFEERFKTQEQRETEAAQRQQQVAAQQQQTALTLQAAHRDLAQMYPGDYKTDLGPNDPNWNRACKYASDAGYIDAYGLRGGLVFAAQQIAAIEAERLVATASPAAAALENVNQQQHELARQQAARAAQSAAGGNVTHATPPAPKPRPSQRDANNKLKPAGQFLEETAAWLIEQRQGAA